MKHGIPQGFVRFGSMAHRVLLDIHENGPQSNASLRLICLDGDEETQLSAALRRMLQYGMVFKVGRERPPGRRSHALYDIEKPRKGTAPLPNLTHAERQQGLRDRRKMRVPSVFQFRGSINL